MIAQSGFDIKVIVNELQELEGSKIEKFYNTPDGELLIKLYSRKYGKVTVRVLRGECIHITNYKRDKSDYPSSFTMMMRKYMKGATLKKIEQPNFERVVIFKVNRGEEEYNIVVELFNKGNIVVCDEEMTILNSLRFVKVKDRIIRPHEKYVLPNPRFMEVFTDKIEFSRIVKSSNRDSIVKTLATEFGLGGKYAEEVCSLADIDKTKEPGMLSREEVERLFKVFFLVYKSVKHYKNIRPCTIMENNEPINFAPFPLKSYKEHEFKFFDTFNEACDFYYSYAQNKEERDKKIKEFEGKIERLESRLRQQEELLRKMEEESTRYSKLGEIVFANYDLINTILTKIREANKNNIPWETIKEVVKNEQQAGSPEANAIVEIDENNGRITLEIDNEQFSVDLNSNATEIAQEFFEKGKKMRSKIPGAKESIEETKREIEKIREQGIKIEEKVVEKKVEDKHWYEKYRWMFTSHGFLLVCGKNATQNEIVVKKVADDNDLIFHTQMAGSPFGVLKDGKDAPQEDKEEVAKFIATFSRAWKVGIPADVFCVSREQVTKSAPSGEYVEHGSFVIVGEKEYFRGIWPDLRIGVNEEGKVIGGPSELIKKKTLKSVKILPGNIPPGKIAKRVLDILELNGTKSEEVLNFIPGDARIEHQEENY